MEYVGYEKVNKRKWWEEEKRQGHNDIRVGTLNIVSRRGNRLEMVCRKLGRYKIDICILKETKLSAYHTVKSNEFKIFATKVKNKNKGGVAMLYQRRENFHIKSPKCYSDNIVKATIIHGRQRRVILGIYIPPSESNEETMIKLNKAMKNKDSSKCIILDDLNINFWSPSKKKDIKIIKTLELYGMKDISIMFKSQKNKPHQWTWQQTRGGKKSE